MSMNRIALSAAALFAGWLLVPGCGADHDPSDGEVGTAQAAVNNVPTDGSVACIAITSTGSWSKTHSFDVTPGQSTVFTLSGIPVGTVRFDGTAYASPCAQVTSGSAPTWVSAPVLATVAIGQITMVTLSMHKAGSAGVGVDFDPNPACSAQGVPCLGGGECCSGFCAPDNTCQPSGGTCGAGQISCNGACVDLMNDSNNCGLCSNVCPMGSTCVNGGCLFGCPPNALQCGGVCVDPLNDPNNCGACNTFCAPGAACINGGCVFICPPNLAFCGGLCADLSNDPNNCGGCGNACPGGAICSNGICLPGSVCGDGLVQGIESCDDANTVPGDGCSPTCNVEFGFTCSGQPSICFTVCGDGVLGGNEQCDDGNSTNGDGCSTSCQIEGVCFDAIKNGAETDVDCGGPQCPACAIGKQCVIGADCQSGLCTAGICQ